MLKTIRDKDFGLDIPDVEVYQERRAARAVVFNKDGKVALLHATKKQYHKLPGGGIEDNEDILGALNREVMEEIGSKINNIKELGIVEEYRNKILIHQLSYCFIANLDGLEGTPNLTEKEIRDGFQTVWLNIDEALKILNSEDTEGRYDGKFINTRDTFLLQEAQKTR